MFTGRCIVLNASYEFMHVTRTWFDSFKLIMKGKARPLAEYEASIRGESCSWRVPAVVVLTEQKRTPRKLHYFNAATKRNVLIRDGFACAYCLRRLTMHSVTKDHILPTSRGGKDTLANVVACCIECNSRKANKTPEEAGMALQRPPRALSEDEKMELLVKTHKSSERSVWRSCFQHNGLTLF